MCDFNNLGEAEKLIYHKQLNDYALAFGGKNFFLQLLEAIRAAKPHPLVAKHSEFRFDLGSITWNKVIFQDKLSLLLQVRVDEAKRGNVLPGKEEKSYKKVLNLVRTLGPIEFRLHPKNSADEKGIALKAFDIIDEATTRINPMFDAIFFCSIETVKKVLNYQPKA